MDASLAVKQLFEYSSFTNIHITFPDPWPNSPHHTPRLFHVDLLFNLNKILIAKGQLYIASDHDEYITSIKQIFNQIKEFKLSALLKKAVGSTNFSRSRTRFEQEFIDQGKDIFYLNYIIHFYKPTLV